MAGTVSQVFRQEHLNWTGVQIVLRVLKLLKDRCICFPVTENVKEDGGQLVDLQVPMLALMGALSSISELYGTLWASDVRSALSDGCWSR